MADNRDRQQRGGRGQQGQKRQYELSTSLVTSPPVRIGKKKWEPIMVIATVLRGKLVPRPSCDVALVVNGAQVGVPKPTDMQSGDATFAFTPSAAGIYAIKVYVVGEPKAQAATNITVEDREPTAQELELADLFRKAEVANLQRRIREAQGQPTDPDVEAAKKAAEIAKHQAEKTEAEKRIREAQKPEKTEKAVDPALTAAETAAKIAGFQADQAAAEKKRQEAEKVEVPNPKKLGTPIVRAEGDEGDYQISVLVPYEDGTPAEGVRVRFLISPLGRAAYSHDEETDDHGAALFHLVFQEVECDVTVHIPPEWEKKIENLQGPSRVRKPEPYKRPSDDELKEGSLWDVVKRARARVLARRERR